MNAERREEEISSTKCHSPAVRENGNGKLFPA